jgi:hypothetical protein
VTVGVIDCLSASGSQSRSIAILTLSDKRREVEVAVDELGSVQECHHICLYVDVRIHVPVSSGVHTAWIGVFSRVDLDLALILFVVLRQKRLQ